MGVADELARLVAQRDAGELTPEQFEAAKAIVLHHVAPDPAEPPPRDEEPSESATPTSSRRRRNRRWALAIAVAIVVGLSVWVIVGESGIGPARVSVRVASVRAKNDDTVLISLVWRNAGSLAGSEVCTLTAKVVDAAGATVTQEISTVSTSSPVPPGSTQRVTIPIVVPAGDASYLEARDVEHTNCQSSS